MYFLHHHGVPKFKAIFMALRSMVSASAARTLAALLVVSCLSGLVVANDAGSGGDAGDSISTAVWLPASNATYYGNLTASSDNNDYYGINSRPTPA